MELVKYALAPVGPAVWGITGETAFMDIERPVTEEYGVDIVKLTQTEETFFTVRRENRTLVRAGSPRVVRPRRRKRKKKDGNSENHTA